MIRFEDLDFEIVRADGSVAENVEMVRSWKDGCCTFRLTNCSGEMVRLKEAVVFRGAMPYPASTRFYGEGFNMLSQYQGTLEHFELAGAYSDRLHYKLPSKKGFFTCYNLLLLFPEGKEILLAGFSSCRRFANEIRFSPDSFEFVVDCGGLELPPGESLDLEEFFFRYGSSREALLEDFAMRIRVHHPVPEYRERITGWCSWYCYGPGVTERNIEENMRVMKEKLPFLRFVQIDDGYQAHMGDWLIPHRNFPAGIRSLCRKIRENGFEPAIWASPFIAEKESELFRSHPEWFLTDEDGLPLPSSRYSFGGWRAAPWYMLDCTIPEVLDYIRTVFRTMRDEWQCRYFKLDGIMWGCMPFGRRRNPEVTSVEAYRAGMRAVMEGAGPDSVILGCNAPMWPSIGVCNAMRITGDINRSWPVFKTLARECFLRNWQNGRLWINDPDCLVLENLRVDVMGPDGVPASRLTSSITPNEFSFHKAHILASGGMILSGDVLAQLSESSLETIRRIMSCYGHTARFSDTTFRYGRMELPERTLHFFFNWDDTGSADYCLPKGIRPLTDFWTGESVAESFSISLPARSARVLSEPKA